MRSSHYRGSDKIVYKLKFARKINFNSFIISTNFIHIQFTQCLDVAKEARPRESQRADPLGLDFNSQIIIISTNFIHIQFTQCLDGAIIWKEWKCYKCYKIRFSWNWDHWNNLNLRRKKKSRRSRRWRRRKMRSGKEREDQPEGFHQVSDQSDLTGPRKPHSKQYRDGPTDKVGYRVMWPWLKTVSTKKYLC